MAHDDPLVIGERHIDDMKEVVERAMQEHPQEGTLVEERLGVPSAIVRVDATIVVDGDDDLLLRTIGDDAWKTGELRAYEVDDRPMGIGLSMVTCEGFGAKLRDLRGTWDSDVVVMVHESREDGFTDDYLWTRVVTPDELTRLQQPAIIRCMRDQCHELKHLAFAPIQTEGFKMNGATPMSHLLVTLGDDGEIICDGIDLTRPAFFKPQIGTRTWGITPFAPSDHLVRNRLKGWESVGKVRNALKYMMRHGATPVVQPFAAPMLIDGGDNPLATIIRYFYGYDASEETWKPIGGMWCGIAPTDDECKKAEAEGRQPRPPVISHGTDHSIFGPVYVE